MTQGVTKPTLKLRFTSKKLSKIFVTTFLIHLFFLSTSFCKSLKKRNSSTNVKFTQHTNPTQNPLRENQPLAKKISSTIIAPSKDNPASNKINEQQVKKPSKKEEKKKDKEKADIYLNFEQASLLGVVNYLSEQKKINLIPGDSKIKQALEGLKVTLSTRKPLTLERAWDVLLTLLELNNFTIIEVDGIYRISPRTERDKEPLPLYSSGTGTEPEDLPDSDLVVRYIYFLQNISEANVSSLLQGMLEGTVKTNKDLDALIITDKCINIKAAFKIIKELDLGGLRESIKMVTLKYIDADYIEQIFGEIIPKEDAKKIRFIKPSAESPTAFFSPDTKIIRYEPKNALILLGLEKNLNKIIDFIFKYLDVPLTAAESMLHIKEIKYAKANDLKMILEAVVKAPNGTPKTAQYKFFEDVAIVADSIKEKGEKGEKYIGGGNRLIIACNKEEWKRLEKLIEKLDKPQPQVAFEVLIVDISIEKHNEIGAQFKPKHQNLLGKGTKMMFHNLYEQPYSSVADMNKITVPTRTNTPVTTLTLGKSDPATDKNDLWAVVQTYISKNNSNLIAQPFLVVNNHEKCTLDFYSQRWVTGMLGRSVGTEPTETKTKEEAHKKIELIPHINKEGLISLEVDVQVESFQNKADPRSGDTADRTLTTRVNIASGEVLVLGGLTKTSLLENNYKIPLLGDIPILGNLFRGKNETTAKTNLYIFIRPSIIKPRPSIPDEYTQLKLDFAKHELIVADEYPREKDPIQRWFFKPATQTIKQRVADAKTGIFRPVDNYASGFSQPKSVDIKHDPYYRVEEAIKEEKEKEETEKKKKPNQRKLKRRRKNKTQTQLAQ